MTLIWRMVRALCADDGEERQWLAVVDYLVAENRVLREQLSSTGRRPRLCDEQRRVLAVLGRRLKPALRPYISIVKPETVMAWYRRLVTARYDSSEATNRRPGRPPTAEVIRELICRIARENSSWGYTRIRDQLRHLGHEIGRTTIVDILRKAGLTPDPEARRKRTWAEFIDQHRAVIWATELPLRCATFPPFGGPSPSLSEVGS